MSPTLMPHAVCWRQDTALIWTMAVSNAITGLSYLTICVTLFYLAQKTRGAVRRNWAFFLIGFGLFIVACGSTHLMEVVTTWIPAFWADAWTNIATAVLSAYVAVEFARKAAELGFGVNDYAARLASSERERARVEDSLLSARKLEEWNRMSTVVAHEINNPLAAIGNLLYLMQVTPGLSPEHSELVQRSNDELKRIEAITRSTLGFFRQGKAPEMVNLEASAEAVRFLLGPMFRQQSLELKILSKGDCTVCAFAVETRQVMLNLVRNACEASPGGGQVTVEMEGRADEVCFVVADSGPGIDPSVRDRLFEFGVSTKGEEGNGMGLWLVRTLVQRHGGSVTVESTPGQGARFTVIWPRRMPEPGPAPEPLAAGAGR